MVTSLAGFATFLALATILGLSIFLSLPVILTRSGRSRSLVFLNAAAIGLLLFLLADVFGNVASLLAVAGTFQTNFPLDAIFVVAVVTIYLLLYVIDRRPPSDAPDFAGGPPAGRDVHPGRLALIIAIGIGLQNLTEGLVFGAAWSAGEVGLLSVVFLGFLLQNISEGFPIVAPFLGGGSYRLRSVVGLFLIGGLPTIFGGAIGYFATSTPVEVLFFSLAVGAILYVIAPMLKVAFRPEPTALASYLKQRLVFLGLLTGFVIGFIVNAL